MTSNHAPAADRAHVQHIAQEYHPNSLWWCNAMEGGNSDKIIEKGALVEAIPLYLSKYLDLDSSMVRVKKWDN